MTVSSIRMFGILALLVAGIPRAPAASARSSDVPAPEVAVSALPAAPDSTEDALASAALESNATAAGLSSYVLIKALEARARLIADGRTASPILTIIDFSKPSRAERLWVLDLKRDSVLAKELVAHGNNSGGDLATAFSNRLGSNQSSLGTYLTGATYTGKHGLSLRLHGLDAGVNDAAFDRAVVVHGADYVRSDIVPHLGRLGRSQGCPALTRESAPRIIDLIKDGTVLFAWHPSLEE